MRRRIDAATFWPWALFALVLGAPIGWGVHASYSWDVDNIAPGSVLRGMAAHFGAGWYSSYGPVPYLATALAYAPILSLGRLTGELGQPGAVYPWGFRHPDAYIALLTIAARLVTLGLAIGVAILASRSGTAGARPATGAPPTRRSGWIALALLAGSPAFVYHARTSNVDLHALFWAWLAVTLAERPAVSLRAQLTVTIAAVLALCSKEQTAPLGLVAVVVTLARAWRAPRAGRIGGPARALVLALVAALAYGLVWNLPLNLEGWREHHRFIFETARYPRTFPASPMGFLQLAGRCIAQAPGALGWPVLAGLALAVWTRPRMGGLGVRAWAVGLYLLAFIGSIGYVYSRLLLPGLILALPVAQRGLEGALDRLGSRARAGLAASLAALVLTGGPALDVLTLGDTRYALERWLSRLPTGTTLEVAGNPRFQARIERRFRWWATTRRSLEQQPRGPVGDVVLISSIDAYEVEGSAAPPVFAQRLHDPSLYRLALEIDPPPWSFLAAGCPVSPSLRAYRRVDAPPVPR